jgi:hypothetical protein
LSPRNNFVRYRKIYVLKSRSLPFARIRSAIEFSTE